MMDVRELVTKFSFQVNSKAVKDFIGLLAKAETSLDNLGKKTTVNAGKARVEGEKRTQREIANIQKRWDDRRRKRYTEEQRYNQWLQRGSIGEKARMAGMFSGIKIKRTGSEDLVGFAKKTRLSLNQPTPNGGGGGGRGGGFSLADTYFNVQLLKDAYQLFYNIAEATRQTAVNILRTNDALSMSIAKIGVITGDTKNASKNFKELLDISAETGSEIGVIEEIFNRLSIGKEGLGATTDQIVDFTSAIAKMSAFSEGGPAQQGALRQLGQMFGGAYIQAQEWNSIVDGLPMVASKIAKAMGTTREAMTFKIRQQTKDSPAYLIKDIFPKLLKILPEIEAEFKNLPPTLDRTLNKAGVGLLKFSLNLKESVKMPELDAFYSRLDGTIQKIFKWADANKALIGTNINKFFGTLGDVLGSVDTQLKDTKGSAKILNDTFYVLNETVKFIKGTFDALLWTLQTIKPLMEWIHEHPTATNVGVGAGGGAIIGGRVAGPVGAVVGATAGGIAGLFKSRIDIEQKERDSIRRNKANAKANTAAVEQSLIQQQIRGRGGAGNQLVQNTNINIASLGAGVTPTQAKQLGQSLATGYNKVGTLKGAFA